MLGYDGVQHRVNGEIRTDRTRARSPAAFESEEEDSESCGWGTDAAGRNGVKRTVAFLLPSARRIISVHE